MLYAFGVDVTTVGLDEMREYPELVPACGEQLMCFRDSLTDCQDGRLSMFLVLSCCS